MSDNFELCLKFVLSQEGGYANNPADPGGATNFGVTQKTYTAWLLSKNKPYKEVELISTKEVKEIYSQEYWQRVKGDDLPLALALVMFDAAVQSGVSQSVKWLQTVLKNSGSVLEVDGIFGVQTLKEINFNFKTDILKNMIDLRMKYLNFWAKSKAKRLQFLEGFRNRIKDLTEIAMIMAAQGYESALKAIEEKARSPRIPKKVKSSSIKIPNNSNKSIVSIAAASAVGGGAMIKSIADQYPFISSTLSPFSNYTTVSGIIAVCAFIAVGYNVYKNISNNNKAEEIKKILG